MADATVGALRVDLSANTARFEEGLKNAENTLHKWASNITQIAAGIGLEKAIEKTMSAVVGFVVDGFESIDKVGKEAQKAGIGTEAFSGLLLSAQLADVGMEELTKSFVKLSKAMVEGKSTFDDLGISVKNANGTFRSTDQVFRDVADKFKSMEDGALKTALATEIFGKAGAQLIPLLNSGATGLDEMRAAADRMGLVITQTTAKNVEKFNDDLKTINAAFEGLRNQLVEQIIPSLTALSGALADSAKQGNSFGNVVVNFLAKEINKFVFELAAAVTQTQFVIQALTLFGSAIKNLITFNLEQFNKEAEKFNKFIENGPPRVMIFAQAVREISTEFDYLTEVTKKLQAQQDEANKANDKFAKSMEELEFEIAKARGEFDKLPKGFVEAVIKLKGFEDGVNALRAGIANLSPELQILLNILARKEAAELQKKAMEDAAAAAEKYNAALTKLKLQNDIADLSVEGLSKRFGDQALQLGLVDAARLKAIASGAAMTEAETKLNNELLRVDRRKLLEESLGPMDRLKQKIEELRIAQIGLSEDDEKFQKLRQQQILLTAQMYTMAAEGIVGPWANLFATLAKENKKFALAAKATAIAMAIINTAEGVTKTIATLGFPLAAFAIPAVIAAGAVQIATITAQQFAKGGSFRVAGGMTGLDSEMVAFRATPGEMVDIRRPGQDRGGGGVQEITLRSPTPGDFFSTHVRDLVKALNRAAPDGYILKVAQ